MRHTKVSKIGKGPSPFSKKMLSPIEVAQIRELSKNNLSMRRIAELTGISRNTLSKYLHGAEPVIQRRNAKTQWLQKQ